MQKAKFVLLALFTSMCMMGGANVSVAADEAQAQQKTQAKTQKSEVIYGSQLMTAAERAEYRTKMRSLKTKAERDAFRMEHHQKMQERAREMGKTLPDMPPVQSGGACGAGGCCGGSGCCGGMKHGGAASEGGMACGCCGGSGGCCGGMHGGMMHGMQHGGAASGGGAACGCCGGAGGGCCGGMHGGMQSGGAASEVGATEPPPGGDTSGGHSH